MMIMLLLMMIFSAIFIKRNMAMVIRGCFPLSTSRVFRAIEEEPIMSMHGKIV